ncbi:MAG: M36 family metallopeptidase [Bdellovibrionales bacterium]|nr:M36 family metallopeptidase [Bdellovibrionales bacterium]
MKTLASGTGATGSGKVFAVDPMVSSGNSLLSPTSTTVGNFSTSVTLQNLTGKGVLEGSFVTVIDGQSCEFDFNAYSTSNDFQFDYSNKAFQEVTAYHAGDRFRSELNSINALLPTGSETIVSNCMDEDNAYYQRYQLLDGSIYGEVCLGNSQESFGAHYADDSTVVIHELQHGTTGKAYSSTEDLNQLFYDEAGSLNEAISDFMAMTFLEPQTTGFDTRIFSRWALGSFFGADSYNRGGHKCPEYDATFPTCSGYALGAAGFDAATNRASYAYPDGLSWKFAKDFTGPGFLQSAFYGNPSHEQIHNNAPLMAGALYDMYDGLKAENGGNQQIAFQKSAKVVIEALKLATKPTVSNRTPVTFRSFASTVNTTAGLLGYTAGEQTAITNALTARGLLGGSTLAASWASVGTGSTEAAGVKIVDNPNTLKSWIASAFGSNMSAVVTHTTATGLNNRLNAGEVVAIWFDIKNDSTITAGGINVKAQSLDPDVTFLDGHYNYGYISSTEAQIMYSKINGSAIVTALGTGTGAYSISTENRYFKTNPYYASTYRTALWMKVSSTASPKTVTIRLTLTPSNGATTTVDFPVTIY